MANQSYAQGSVTVTTTATKVCTVPAENDNVMVQTGASAVFFGGPSVTATGATVGISVPASTIQSIPSASNVVHDLYAIVASGTGTVVYLYPAV